MTYIKKTQVKNANNVVINPSTEETLLSILEKMTAWWNNTEIQYNDNWDFWWAWNLTYDKVNWGVWVKKYIDFSEITIPDDPTGETARLYWKDKWWITKLYYKDSTWFELEIWLTWIIRPITTKTVDYTATVNDYTILCNTTSWDITITLPPAWDLEGIQYVLKKIDSSWNIVIIDWNWSETIDWELTKNISPVYWSLTIQSDWSNWFII